MNDLVENVRVLLAAYTPAKWTGIAISQFSNASVARFEGRDGVVYLISRETAREIEKRAAQSESELGQNMHGVFSNAFLGLPMFELFADCEEAQRARRIIAEATK